MTDDVIGPPADDDRHLPLGADRMIRQMRRKLRWFIVLTLLFGPGLALGSVKAG